MNVFVALLRGVNVGGNCKLPMKDLAAMFAALGCSDVVTYIQSGNVVFRCKDAVAARIPRAITEAISDKFGFRPALVLRTSEELRKVVSANPFLGAGADIEKLHVAFLADKPSAAKIAALDPRRSPPDDFVVHGREIYLHTPHGFARTKLTNAYFDSKLETTSTVRNWKTVLKLQEMSAS